MKKTIITLLILCIGLNLCACKDTKETKESAAIPGASASAETVMETEDAYVPSLEPESTNRANATSEPDNLSSTFSPNEFEMLNVDFNNFIAIDKELSAHLAVKTRSYEIEKKQYQPKNHRGKLEVEYPKFIGDYKKFSKVNEMILRLVDSYVYVEENDDFVDCYIEYEIQKASDEFISIAFTGYNYFRSAMHTSKCEFTFNYDLKDKKLIELNQITNLDISFLEKSKGALASQAGLEMYKAIIATNGDVMELLNRLKDEQALFYFEEDKIYVGFTVNDLGFNTTYVYFDYR